MGVVAHEHEYVYGSHWLVVLELSNILLERLMTQLKKRVRANSGGHNESMHRHLFFGIQRLAGHLFHFPCQNSLVLTNISAFEFGDPLLFANPNVLGHLVD
jgi:hypothetical protein